MKEDITRQKSIAYVMGELFFYEGNSCSYVSRFSSGNFLKLLQGELNAKSVFVFPVGGNNPPKTYSSIFRAKEHEVDPLPGWGSVLEYYKMLVNPWMHFFLKRKIKKLVSNNDIFWIRIPHPFGLWLGKIAERQGKFVMYNVVGDVRYAYASPKYKGLKKIIAKLAGSYFHKKSLVLGKNSIFFCVGSILCEVYKKEGKSVEFFVDSSVVAEEIKAPKKELYNPVKVLYVGRLTRAKGIYVLMDAVSKLARGHRIELHVVGHGEDAEKTQDLSRGKEHFKFHGFVPQGSELNKIYNGCDILVMPTTSYPEGFPRVILEAWAKGLFVISSDVGGIKSLGKEGENLLFFKTGSVDDLVSKVEEIIMNPELRERLRKGIVEVQKQISSEHMIGVVKKYLEMMDLKIKKS